MAIQALALLKITGLEPLPESSLRIQPLEDAVLLHTGHSFADDPEELTARVRSLIGDTFADRHDDPRGILFVPDVAAPKARSYEAVIQEVGEGGVWGPSRAAPVALPDSFDAGDLSSLLGQMPGSLLDAVSEITRRDPNALHNASQQLAAMIGQSGTQGIGQMLGSAGIDLSAGGLQQLVASMQQELETHPGRLAGLAEQLLGGSARGGAAQDEAEEADEAEEGDEPKR